MKTLKIAIVAAALLIPLSQANAGNRNLRERLNQARQAMTQDFQSIQQESRLFRAAAHKTLPAIQDETPQKVAISLADLSLPGKVATDVLVKSNPVVSTSASPAFSCVISVEFPTFYSAPAPAAK